AHGGGVPVHVGGARLFNAAVALRRDVAEFVRAVDSVTFCLSKGLSAPVGAMICGSKDVIGRARHIRKLLGGGMRQAGVIAAAGVGGLGAVVSRVGGGHEEGRRVGRGLARVAGGGGGLGPGPANVCVVRLGPGGGGEAGG